MAESARAKAALFLGARGFERSEGIGTDLRVDLQVPVAGLAQSGSEWGSTPIRKAILLTVSVGAVAKVTFEGLGWLVMFVVRLLDKLVNDFQLCWLPRWTGEIPG